MATRRSPIAVPAGSIRPVSIGSPGDLTEDDLRALGLSIEQQPAAAPIEEPGMLRSAADTGVALARGVVTGVRGLTDVAGTENVVSQTLGRGIEFLDTLESPYRRAERQRRAQIIKQAEESGEISKEVAAYLGAFLEAPIDTLAEAVGTSAPTLLSLFIPGGQATAGARLLAAAGMGGAQGLGFTKRSIADSVEQGLIESGVPPEEAKARAVEAQRIGGPNTGQLALGTGLGIAAGRFGAEGAVARSLAKTPLAGSRAGAILAATGGEFLTEAVQGGHEQFAGNIAQQREGLDVPTMQGVYGSAALEGVAGAGVGGGLATVAGVGAGAPSQEEPPRAQSLGQMLAEAGQAPGGPVTVRPRPPVRTRPEEFTEEQIARARSVADHQRERTGEDYVVEIERGALAIRRASESKGNPLYSTATRTSSPDEGQDETDPAEIAARNARLLDQIRELAKDPLILMPDERRSEDGEVTQGWRFGAMGKSRRGRRAASLLRRAQEAGIPEADIAAAIAEGNAATRRITPRFNDPNAPREPDPNALERARVRAQALAEERGGRWAVVAKGDPEDGNYEVVPAERLKGRRPLFEAEGEVRRPEPATAAGRMEPGATRTRTPIEERPRWQTAEEGNAFLRSQRRAGGTTFGAKVVRHPAGGFTLAFPDEPQYNDPAWQAQATPTPAPAPTPDTSPGPAEDGAASETPARGREAQGQTPAAGPATSSTPAAGTLPRVQVGPDANSQREARRRPSTSAPDTTPRESAGPAQAEAPAPAPAAPRRGMPTDGRVTQESNLAAGSTVVDADGKQYRVQSQEGGRITAQPLVDGEPQGDPVRFWVDTRRAPEGDERTDPIYPAGATPTSAGPTESSQAAGGAPRPSGPRPVPSPAEAPAPAPPDAAAEARIPEERIERLALANPAQPRGSPLAEILVAPSAFGGHVATIRFWHGLGGAGGPLAEDAPYRGETREEAIQDAAQGLLERMDAELRRKGGVPDSVRKNIERIKAFAVQHGANPDGAPDGGAAPGAGPAAPAPSGARAMPDAVRATPIGGIRARPDDDAAQAESDEDDARLRRSAAAQRRMEAARRVDPSRDTLLVAIARLGGINREEARREWGLRPEELRHRGLVGFPVFRKVGGKSIDEMRLALQELGYLSEDGDPNELEDKITLSLNGTPQYAAAGLEAQAEAEHERRLENEQAAEQDEYVSNQPPELDDEEEARIEREAIQAESEAAGALDDLDDEDLALINAQLSEAANDTLQLDDAAIEAIREEAEALAGAESTEEAAAGEARGPDSRGGEEPGAREGLSPEESQTAAPDTEGESADPLAGIPGTGRIDLQLASRAHEGTSFDPEKRGAAWVREFEATVRADYESLRALAERHGKLDGLDERFARYRDGYATRITAYLASHSRVMSPMIVGPARFPTERNRKRIAAADNRLREAFEFRDRMLTRMRRDIIGSQSISADDADAITKLQAKLSALEQAHERMKAANRILRQRISNEEKIAALRELGFSAEHSAEILKPDFAGRAGFPAYRLANNNAEMARVRARIAQLERQRATSPQEAAFDGGRVVENAEANRLQIFFDSKPEADVRQRLKSNGFRWSPKAGAWQRQRGPQAWGAAQRALGVDLVRSEASPSGLEVRENEADGYQIDLFGQPVRATRARRSRRAEPAQPELLGNVQPATAVQADPESGIQDTPAPEGQYYIRTFVGRTEPRRLAASRIRSADDVARATRYLFESAVERMDGVLTDDDGRPLAVIGGFKGGPIYAPVVPLTLIGEAVRVPDATRVWFSHNHPSGTGELSPADHTLFDKLREPFWIAGIRPMGLIAIGDRTYSWTDGTGPRDEVLLPPPGNESVEVPVIDRDLSRERDIRSREALKSSDQAKLAARQFYDRQKGPGVILLGPQHHIHGWVPLPDGYKGSVRGRIGRALYRALSESNAARAIIVHGGELSKGIEPGRPMPWQNIAAALTAAEIRVLDSIDVTQERSAAETLLTIPATVFSRAVLESSGPNQGTLAKAHAARVQEVVDGLVGDWAVADRIEILTTFDEAPEPVRRENERQLAAGASGVPRAFAWRGRIWLVADQLHTPSDIASAIYHEATHFGLSRVFGESIDPILDDIARRRSAEVKAVARKYGLDFSKERERRIAAEEMLAAMAESNPKAGFVTRAIAAIRNFLDAIARRFGFELELTDAQIIANFIVPAREYARNGGRARGPRIQSRTVTPFRHSPERREVLRLGVAAAAMVGDVLTSRPAFADVLIGRAKPISAEVLDRNVSEATERILRGTRRGAHLDGAQVLRAAFAQMAKDGPPELRPLIEQIRALLPEDNFIVQVDDTRLANAHGAVRWDPLPMLTLYTARGRKGLTYDTILHESLHAAVLARYVKLAQAVVRSNDELLGTLPEGSTRALAQFRGLWDEFRAEVNRITLPEGGPLRTSLREAAGSPDEFFVRMLTDPHLQEWAAGREYKGKTLYERFKDWVKSSLLGFRKSGTAPSWLDAGLAASQDVLVAMEELPPDFERLQTANRIRRESRRGRSDGRPNMSRPAQPFYSALEREVGKINARAQPAAGWKQQIGALVKKGAVKAEEVEWTGINEWLDMQQGRVSKEAVLDFLAENGVRVEEVDLGGRRVIDRLNDALAGTGLRAEHDLDPEQPFIIVDEDDEAVDFDDLPPEAQAIINEAEDTVGTETRYQQLTLPGGRNYRELLLTLPTKGPSRADLFALEDRIAKADRDGDDDEAVRLRIELRKALQVFESQPYFRSSHWDHSNILAHVRFNERTDADGKRVLFIEEIQSDWAQTGRDRGFRGLAETYKVGYDERTGWYAEDEYGSGEGGFATREEAQAWADRENALDPTLPPRAPFVTKTDSWVALALKRMIRYAAENGFDRVAIIDGPTSAERYNLAKHISRVRYDDNINSGVGKVRLEGEPSLGTLRAWDLDGNEVINRFVSEPRRELPDLVGKEVADRLLAQKPTEGRSAGLGHRSRQLEGLALTVGGEGMRTFYDQIVPKVARDVLRKVGGSLGRIDVTIDGETRSHVGFDVTPEMRSKAMEGLPLFSRAQTQTPEFRRWFGDSKVVDENGNPLVVYHGTRAGAPVRVFEAGRSTVNSTTFGDIQTTRAGIFFSDNPQFSEQFGDIVQAVYLRIENPAEVTRDLQLDFADTLDPHTERDVWLLAKNARLPWQLFDGELGTRFVGFLKSKGYDGATFEEAVVTSDTEHKGRTYVAFRPEQIKSAIGNRGTFDPENPDIRFSRSPAQQLMQPGGPTPEAVDALGRGFTGMLMQNWRDSTRNTRTFKWWRGINTQYHKATLDADFKRVFDAAQDFQKDVSRYANRAADLAPTLLPNIASAKDILAKSRVKREDMEKVAEAILAGTLEDADPAKGRVWTTEELRTLFKLNDKQIGLYHEFRNATDRALDDFGRSEVIRFADAHLDPLTRREIMEARNVQEAFRIVRRRLAEVSRGADDDTRKEIAALRRRIEARVDRIEGLINGGYAPLMRFGRYAVWIHHQDSENNVVTDWFSLHDSVREANRTARAIYADIKRENPEAQLRQGIVSDEEHKLFAGITPDTLEVFGEEAGFSDDPRWKKLIELTKSQRSALKRMLERKRTPGFSSDITRILAAFVTSQGRATAGNVHAGELVRAVRAIPDNKGDVKDDAVRLYQYLQNPTEEAQAIRGLLFTWFLGGSVASAAVNITQPLTMSLPYLAVREGAAKATARLLSAARDVIRGKYKPDTARALKRAELEGGVVDPQEVHMLQAEVSRNLGASVRLRKAMFAWGYLFAAAERFNRRVTFVAAYEQAKALGSLDPVGDAELAVVDTQGIYNRANRPNWARGAIPATVMTFKQFSIAYVEFVARLLKNKESRPAGLLALGILIMLSGLSGLPFAEDLDDIVDTVAQAAGYNFQSDAAKQEFLARIFGEQAAEFALYGLSTIPGSPVDVQARLGLGNLIPGTAAFKKSAGPRAAARETVEVFGAAGGLAEDAGDAIKALLEGEPGRAAKTFLPVAAANFAKGLDMLQTGMYRDTRGRKVVDVTTSDAIAKSLGFQPGSVGRQSRIERDIMGSNAVVRATETEIAGLWAQGVFEKDKAKVERARERLRAWNRKNPDTPIRIKPEQIRNRVRQMSLTRGERIIKSSPREVRAAAARALRQQE